MELNITQLIAETAPNDYSASRAELGDNAGAITSGHAVDDALEIFGDQFSRQAFDEYFADFGAWSEDELAAHSDRECAALMLQFISGDIRECDFSEWPDQFSAEWWNEYESASERGIVSGRIFRGDDGQVYFYVGS